MLIELALTALARLHAADLIAVSPTVLSTEGGRTLVLTGDSNGGLLAGSAWAGASQPPSNMTLCCDYNGLSTAIGGDVKATMSSATNGSCPIPPFAATGAATIELYLTSKDVCDGSDCHLGGSPRHCDHGLTGKPSIQVKSPSSILTFAPGRRPYVNETSAALVVRAAAVEDMEPWLPASAGRVVVHVTATLALPSGPKQLFSAPQAVEPGQTTALPFALGDLPGTVDAIVTAVFEVTSSSSGAVLMAGNSSRLFQRFVPAASGPPGSVVQLDRHRRAILVDGDVFQGNGWYGEFGVNLPLAVHGADESQTDMQLLHESLLRHSLSDWLRCAVLHSLCHSRWR